MFSGIKHGDSELFRMYGSFTIGPARRPRVISVLTSGKQYMAKRIISQGIKRSSRLLLLEAKTLSNAVSGCSNRVNAIKRG